MGSIIRIVTTVLSLLGADSVDRTDYGDTFSRLFQLVTSVLQVGLSALPSPSPAPSLFSSKLGETAGSESEEQIAHKQQVTITVVIYSIISQYKK